MKNLLSAIATIFFIVSYIPAFAADCYNSSIRSPVPFMGNDSEILKLDDGSVWEVKYDYEYLYAYYPSVIICPNAGKMIVDKKQIDVQLVSSAVDTSNGKVIESVIVSKFDGLNTGNLYKLSNGQIWEQTEPWIWVWVWVNPSVMIYPAPGGYKMKVESIEHPVFVKRIK